jgi:alanine-glyoxylate transaminase / serine-glyoxylate transaminase / serine-pyruvate transaminase
MKQRKLLMIPGPIEFTPEVLASMALPTTSHVAPNFIEVFGQAIERLRTVFASPTGQPFVVAGSGTLAMDMAAANLVEPGDAALVVNTGYFSDRFAAILSRYGAAVTHVRAAEVGGTPSLEQVETALRSGSFKLLTITHVDTSTAVRADVQGLTALGRKHGALVVADGVCSIAGEELQQDAWGVDLALTASQKALGTPPGLAVLVAGVRAIERFKARRTPVQNYYCDWTEWLPIMRAYEERKPSYFGTPPVNLIWALNVSLGQILGEGMAARVQRHRRLSNAFKEAATALGLRQVPTARSHAADTLTALYYPAGTDAAVVGRMGESGVIVAGGLHPEIKTRYFRVGHMGAVNEADILAVVGALESALSTTPAHIRPGAGLEAAARFLIHRTE